MTSKHPKSATKVISLFLVTALLLVIFAACSQTQPPEPTIPDEPPSVSSLNGIALNYFTIVYSADDYGYNQRAAQYIQSEIASRTNISLPMVKDSDNRVTPYEILVGNTSRDISSRLEPVADSVQFNILAEKTQIAMEGEYFVIAAAAYYFVNTYIPENDYVAQIPKEVTTHDPIVEEADNYIIMIGDGMGVNQTQLFRLMINDRDYGHGEDTFFGYYLPYSGFSRTDNVEGKTTDSAAGATALGCGYKTYNAYIGQDGYHNPVQSLTELAGSLGKATGIMSTEEQTGATPSAFSAHVNFRKLYDDIKESQTVTQQTYGTIIDCDYDVYDREGIAAICEKVTNNLNTLGEDPEGFFLMYEEAYIDKHCAKADLDEAFDAVIRFNRVIAVVMEYAFYHPNTFVLITADHETGGLTEKDGQFKNTTLDHTSADVPIFVYGMGSEIFDGQTIENIQIPMTIASLWGVDTFGDQTTFKPLTK